jgi:hypothetical protein
MMYALESNQDHPSYNYVRNCRGAIFCISEKYCKNLADAIANESNDRHQNNWKLLSFPLIISVFKIVILFL